MPARPAAFAYAEQFAIGKNPWPSVGPWSFEHDFGLDWVNS